MRLLRHYVARNDIEKYNELSQDYDKISAMLYKLIKNWRKF
jgi:hypothetical protein